jgi:hypothetical protein
MVDHSRGHQAPPRTKGQESVCRPLAELLNARPTSVAPFWAPVSSHLYPNLTVGASLCRACGALFISKGNVPSAVPEFHVKLLNFRSRRRRAMTAPPAIPLYLCHSGRCRTERDRERGTPRMLVVSHAATGNSRETDLDSSSRIPVSERAQSSARA